MPPKRNATQSFSHDKIAAQISERSKVSAVDDDSEENAIQEGAKHYQSSGMSKQQMAELGAQQAGYDLVTFETEVKDFPMADEEINGTNQILFFVGKRRTGKSWAIRDYLYTYRDAFPYGYVCWNSIGQNFHINFTNPKNL